MCDMYDIIVNPKQLIIIGGGYSLKEGISKGLWDKIKSKFVIGLNYSYNYFPNPTIQCFVDRLFYAKESKKEKFQNLSLIIGTEHKIDRLSNTIMLKDNSKYKRDIRLGCYKSSLVGLFALSLGIYLLDIGEIYLLGYDMGELRKKDYEKFLTSKHEIDKLVIKDKKNRALTHFYQGNIEHRGVGKIAYYNDKDRAKNDFGIYKKEKKVKIYNVSLVSKIPSDIFEKISYDQFFKKLDNKQYDQNLLIQQIKNKLKRRD